jgi:hypothetical protein
MATTTRPRLGLEPIHVRAEADRTGPVARSVGIVTLAAVALIHLLDAPGKYEETRWMFWAYVVLMAALAAVAAFLYLRESVLAWSAALVLGLATLVGFVLTRTSGLPGAKDDIGNWSEPLGMASLFVEGMLVVLSAARLVELRRDSA